MLAAETGTLGVRGARLERWPRARRTAQVEVDGQPVRVKGAPAGPRWSTTTRHGWPSAWGVPLRQVLARAEAAWWAQPGADGRSGPGAGAAPGDLADATPGHPTDADTNTDTDDDLADVVPVAPPPPPPTDDPPPGTAG